MKAAFAAAACFSLAGHALAEPPPASAFGRIPAVVDAAISPNGQHVAILGGAAEQRTVSVATIDQPGLPVVTFGDMEAVDLRWAGDQYVLVRLAMWKKSGPRVAYRMERNIAVTADGKTATTLLSGDAASNALIAQPVLGVVAASPVRALVLGLSMSAGPSGDSNTHFARKGVDDPFIASLWSVDPATGKGVLVEHGDYDTAEWAVDLAGEPRVRLQVDQNSHRFSILGRAKGARIYSPIWSGDPESYRGYHGYSVPDDGVYVGEDGGIVLKRLADGQTQPVGHKGGALNPTLVWDQVRQTAVGVKTQAEKPAVEWLDPEVGAVHASLSKAFAGKVVNLSNWSADRSRFVVRVSAPAAPAAWYLFDKTRKELSPLGEEYPELKDATLGTTRWITYKARDGMEIPAYLTLPPGPAPIGGALRSLIVLPHGGPTARDDYDFDFLAQFLATRGYAVLQPEFRGSWGFGRAFEDAGRGEWGGKMQTDLLDGVAAVAASDGIDPGRVCIVGASFGGYAALAGASLNPDSYRCAASFAGISDLGLLLIEEGRYYGKDSQGLRELRTMLGDASLLKIMATSPRRQAAHVKIPVLLIHGDKDTVVPLEQSQVMADALKAEGKPVEMVVLHDENHYLTRTATRTQMLQVLETFLAKNLPVAR